MNTSFQRPLVVGVTGGIGAGKSVVCQLFRAFGTPVYEADEQARRLVDHDPILKADIRRLLGPEAYDPSGRYNRSWVAAQVFGYPELLNDLNALIHPRVLADTENWVQSHAGQRYVIKEAALMRAAGDGNSLDKVVVVQAPLPLRIERIRRRDPHRTEQEIRHIIDRQLSDEDRSRIADYVVFNDEKQLLTPQIAHLHQLFSGLSADAAPSAVNQ